MCDDLSVDLTARGTSGEIVFDGRVVMIRRVGLARFTQGRGEKRIPVRHITGVSWRDAGPVMNGSIGFSIPGASERPSRFGHATMDAVRDSNSVVFTKGQEGAFLLLRDAIDEAIAQATS